MPLLLSLSKYIKVRLFTYLDLLLFNQMFQYMTKTCFNKEKVITDFSVS